MYLQCPFRRWRGNGAVCPDAGAKPDSIYLNDHLWLVLTLFKNIYVTGKIPSEMLKSVFIASPKES